MKKIYAFVLFLLSLSLMVAFSGCAQKLSSSSEEILLAGFDSYEEMITYHYLNNFGSAQPDKTYVTQGESGAYLQINGTYTNTQKPTIVIDTYGDYLDKTDYSDVAQVLLDVKNANEYAVNVYLQYVSETETGTKTSSEMKVPVNAGFEGTITFQIDRSIISAFLNITRVTEIRLLFDGPKEAIPTLSSQEESFENYRRIYIDNLRAVTTESSIEHTEIRREREIESGDRAEYTAAWYLPSGYQWGPSTVSYNTQEEFIKAGSGSLRFLLEGTNSTNGSSRFTAQWSMSVETDISDYYSLTFSLYLDDETPQSVGFYLHSTVDNTEKFIKYLNYGWNDFEFTVADLRDVYMFDVEHFRFGCTFYALTSQDTAVYLDEMWVNDYEDPYITLPEGENIGNLYYAQYDAPGEIEIPVPTVEYTDTYSVKVKGPDGQVIPSESGSFTASTYGEYQLTYTAETNAEHRTTLTCLIAVGAVPEFNYTPEDIYLSGGNYTAQLEDLTDIATASGAQVSWTAGVYRLKVNAQNNKPTIGNVYSDYNSNGYTKGMIVGSPEQIYILSGFDHRIVYTAVNDLGLRALHIQHIFSDSDVVFLDERYENLFADMYVSGDVYSVVRDSSFSLNNEQGRTFLNSKKIVIRSDGTRATGSLNNNILVGYQCDLVHIFMRNAGEYPVMVTINKDNTQFTLVPGAYAIFDPESGGTSLLYSREIITQESVLGKLNFTVTSERNGIELEVLGIAVNEDAFRAPTFEAPNYSSYVEIGTSVTVMPAIINGVTQYRYSVIGPDQEVVVSGAQDNLQSFAMDTLGVYTIVYTLTYDGYDGKVAEVEKRVEIEARASVPQFINEESAIVNWTGQSGVYTLQADDKPDLSLMNGAVLTEVSVKETRFNIDGLVETDVTMSGETFIPVANSSYRIAYTIEGNNSEYVCTRTLFFLDENKMNTAVSVKNMESLFDIYPDYFTTGTVSDESSVLASQEKITVALQNKDTNYRYLNRVSIGNAQDLLILFYNPNEFSIEIVVSEFGVSVNKGNTLHIGAHQFATFNMYERGIKIGYGVNAMNFASSACKLTEKIDEIQYLKGITVFTPDEYNGASIEIRGIWLNENPFTPSVTVEEYEDVVLGSTVSILPAVVSGAQGYTYTVFSPTGEQELTGQSEDIADASFAANEAGEWTIKYTVSYNVGESSQTLVVTKKLSVNPAEVTIEACNVIDWSGKSGQTYTISQADRPVGVPDGATVTWTIEESDCSPLSFNVTYLPGENPASFTPTVNHSYLIKYVVQLGSWQSEYYRTLFFRDMTDMVLLSDYYSTLYSAGTTNSAAAVIPGEDGVTFKFAATTAHQYTNIVNAENAPGKLTTIQVLFYNPTDTDIDVSFVVEAYRNEGWNVVKIKAHHFSVFTISNLSNAGTVGLVSKDSGTGIYRFWRFNLYPYEEYDGAELFVFGVAVNAGAFSQ